MSTPEEPEPSELAAAIERIDERVKQLLTPEELEIRYRRIIDSASRPEPPQE